MAGIENNAEASVKRPELLRDRRVTLMGLGRHGGGVAAARFLAKQGARLTVTDTADAATLATSLSSIADLAIERLHLGRHEGADFTDADLVVVNPAVRPNNSYVEQARRSGATISSEIELFLDRCRGPVVGVTGTNGKSTTAAMIAAIIEADGRDVRLGGNIERSLLSQLDEIGPDTWCVLELSSFQLHWLSDTARRPDIAVVTNCEPNHLDWHDSLETYREAKRRMMGRQPFSNTGTEAKCFDPTGALGEPTHELATAAADLPPLHVSGKHNKRNAALAAIVAGDIGCSHAAIREALANYQALPHRLEHVAKVAGRTFVDDSQATTPGSTIAAIDAMGPGGWLLAGGADKGSNLTQLANAIVRQTKGAAFFGQLGPQLQRLVRSQRPDFNSRLFERLADAFDWCTEQSQPDETILLSPGCASLDQYQDYAARAADFRRCVERLQKSIGNGQHAAAEDFVDAI